jgi:hypothetical protein
VTFSQGQHTTGVCGGGGLNHYQCLAADCLQRPLVPRSRFRQQLKAGVDMTSNVKGGPQIFLGLHDVFVLGTSAEAEPAICDG